MKNNWLKKEIGTITYTNMCMCEENIELPATFYIHKSDFSTEKTKCIYNGEVSYLDPINCHRCYKKDDSNLKPLIWKSLEILVIDGKEIKLKGVPKYSTIQKDYIFYINPNS